MTRKITVLGVVQGVGFRPFVLRLAQECGITGTVMNSGGIVQITAHGTDEATDIFVHRLKTHQPPGADVQQILTQELSDRTFKDFRIVASDGGEAVIPVIPPDLPLCDHCRRELYDPENRRYRYPFISCVACGPRYTIIEALPYDRETTTMDDFAMCPACGREYRETDDRRCHAQTIACHDCGPQLLLQVGEGAGKMWERDEALGQAVALLKQGRVLAVKGIGGYQFACLPTDEGAVEQLRLLKHRDKKPFAVMFPSLAVLRDNAHVSEEEERLLISSARPIVLLTPKSHAFSAEVSGDSRFLGAFLAYTALHQLLLDACGPLVMTSGNVTSEPIITRDEDMLALRSPSLAGVLYNKRRIVTPLDDSLARVIDGKPQLIRRSRGYVPLPLFLSQSAPRPLLAMGGDLKSGFCLYAQDRAYLSQYFGDMEQYAVSLTYRDNLKRMERLFGIHPERVVCDRHPEYFTTQLAQTLTREHPDHLVTVQHHHAHAASVMAEHGLRTCIGVVFDGTGYGTDGAVWGGEFLLCRDTEYVRKAHLSYVTMCGGDQSSRNAELAAACYRFAAGEFVDAIVQAALTQNVQTHQSSSMGRLFDAVSAVLEIRRENSYEAECAIALENTAAAYAQKGGSAYPLRFAVDADGSIDQTGILREIDEAYRRGEDKGALALGFHHAVSEMVRTVCGTIRGDGGENTVALSGGVFANQLLTQQCVDKLKQAGFAVYLNEAVPTNDSGICLGQAWLGAQMP